MVLYRTFPQPLSGCALGRAIGRDVAATRLRVEAPPPPGRARLRRALIKRDDFQHPNALFVAAPQTNACLQEISAYQSLSQKKSTFLCLVAAAKASDN